jgi:murein DD-endopeptidase MepM/ murein hydrolase activator NlpD
MKKSVALCAALALGAAAAFAQAGETREQEGWSPEPTLEIRGMELYDEAELELIEGGREVCESPNEGRYTDQVAERLEREFNEAVERDNSPRARAKDEYVSSSFTAATKPVAGPFTVTCPTGPRNINIGGLVLRGHSGTDIRAPVGSGVFASKTGMVKESSTSPKYGGVVIIDNVDGTKSTYMHVVADPKFAFGGFVLAGTQIAQIGQSGVPNVGGTLSTGPHLHYAMQYRDGTYASTAEVYGELYNPHGKDR